MDEDFDEWLQQAKEKLKPEKKKRERGKMDFAHWNRLTEEQKNELLDKIKVDIG